MKNCQTFLEKIHVNGEVISKADMTETMYEWVCSNRSKITEQDKKVLSVLKIKAKYFEEIEREVHIEKNILQQILIQLYKNGYITIKKGKFWIEEYLQKID